MKSRPVLAFVALVLGSATASVYGCAITPVSPGTAHADGAGGSGGAGGAGTCQPTTCTPAAPTKLSTYQEVLSTLQSGVRVRVVLDYSVCKLGGKPAPNAQGAMNLDTFEWFGKNVIGNPKAFLAGSENHLIRLQSGFVYDYARVRLSEDDKVAIDVQYLDPKTFAVTVDETIDCGISDASQARGATFYKMP
jgi:hypothetical protein